MSEQQNVETMKRFYEAFTSGNIPAMLNLVTDDFVLSNDFTVKVPTAGKFLGKQGLERFFSVLAEEISEVQIFQPDEYIASGERVVVLGHERMRVRATGRVVNAKWAQVATFRDSLMSRFDEYSDTAAWDVGFGGDDV